MDEVERLMEELAQAVAAQAEAEGNTGDVFADYKTRLESLTYGVLED